MPSLSASPICAHLIANSATSSADAHLVFSCSNQLHAAFPLNASLNIDALLLTLSTTLTLTPPHPMFSENLSALEDEHFADPVKELAGKFMAHVIDIVLHRVVMEEAAGVTPAAVDRVSVSPAHMAHIIITDRLEQQSPEEQSTFSKSMTCSVMPNVLSQKKQSRKWGERGKGFMSPTNVHHFVDGDYMFTSVVAVSGLKMHRSMLDAGVFKVEQPAWFECESPRDCKYRCDGFSKLFPISANLVETWEGEPFLWRRVNIPEYFGYQYWLDPKQPGRTDFINLSPHLTFWANWHGYRMADKKFVYGLPLEWGIVWWDTTAFGEAFEVEPIGTLCEWSTPMKVALMEQKMVAVPGLNPRGMEPHTAQPLSTFISICESVAAAESVKAWVEETRGARVIEVCAQVAAEELAVEAAKAADEAVRFAPPAFLLESGEEEEEGGEEDEEEDAVARRVFAPLFSVAAKVELLKAKLKEAEKEQQELIDEALDSAPLMAREETINYFKKQRLM